MTTTTARATAEHVFPAPILVGLGTHFSALALVGMTLVIQRFVYPGGRATRCAQHIAVDHREGRHAAVAGRQFP